MKTNIKKAFTKAAAHYDQHADVQRFAAQCVHEDIQDLSLKPSHILDLGCGTGILTSLLQKRFRFARIDALDFSCQMLQMAKQKQTARWLSLFKKSPSYICADAHHLPLAAQQYDLVASNLALQWCHMEVVLKQCLEVLKPGGTIIFSTLGVGTLYELEEAFEAAIGQKHTVNSMLDIQQLGDILASCGFANSVVSEHEAIMRFSGLKTALRSIKNIGSKSLQGPGIITPKAWLKLLKAYEIFRLNTGEYPLTYRLLFATATKPSGPKTAKTNTIQHIDIADIAPTDAMLPI